MTGIDLHKNYPEYYNFEGDCLEHGNYKCPDCYNEATSRTNSIVQVVSQKEGMREVTKQQARENFTSQVDFIQTALDMDEKKLDKVKVSELDEYFTKAKREITVGKMKKLLNVNQGPKGVVAGAIRQMKILLGK